MKKNQFTVGCCFAGMGGFAQAFQKEGFRINWAIEIDKKAAQIFSKSFPKAKVITEDIKNVRIKKNQENLWKVDVITGGFPCQPFSRAGSQKGTGDRRSGAIFEFFNFLQKLNGAKPRIVLLENVTDILKIEGGNFYQELKNKFYQCGFVMSESTSYVLEAFTNTGIPQFRERLFLAAINKTICPSFNTTLYSKKAQPKSLFSTKFVNTKKREPSKYYFKEDSPFYPLFLKEYQNVKSKKTTFLLRRNYVRSNKKGISFTLVASMGSGGHNVPVIKDRWGFRRLTPHECAKLQGWERPSFPKTLIDRDLYKAIGNSVVIDVVQIVANHLKSNLLKINNL